MTTEVQGTLQVLTLIVGLLLLVFRGGVWAAKRSELERRVAELEQVMTSNVRKRLHRIENRFQFLVGRLRRNGDLHIPDGDDGGLGDR